MSSRWGRLGCGRGWYRPKLLKQQQRGRVSFYMMIHLSVERWKLLWHAVLGASCTSCWLLPPPPHHGESFLPPLSLPLTHPVAPGCRREEERSGAGWCRSRPEYQLSSIYLCTASIREAPTGQHPVSEPHQDCVPKLTSAILCHNCPGKTPLR
jgi:hypothetical protein